MHKTLLLPRGRWLRIHILPSLLLLAALGSSAMLFTKLETNNAIAVEDAAVEARDPAQGLWRARNIATTHDPHLFSIPPPTFRYEDGHVTLRLITMKAWMWKTADDHYKVKARWQGKDLQYLPPFGRWTYLASFEKDHFTIANRQDFIFESIQASELEDYELPLMTQRKAHDYSIEPLSPREDTAK